jgi:hypothetical protein
MKILDPRTGECVVLDFQKAKERLRPVKLPTHREKVDRLSKDILKALGLIFVVDDAALHFKHEKGDA